jgi:protoporphyrinogen/coproporphyrinogen III oxidase
VSRAVVVGGGIAGLAAAVRLADGGGDVVLLEASERVGGKIRSERIGDAVFEHGPNGFLDNEPATLELVQRAGLESRLISARDDAKRRYVWLGDRLRRLPDSPPALLRSDVLSLRGKLRAALDLFLPRAPAARAEKESVADFARRRLGSEALTALVEPFVSGVFAGDAERLELVSAFPRIAALEREHGGVIRALLRRRGGPRAALRSFAGGMQELPDALARLLGDRVRTRAETVSIEPIAGGRWRVRTATEELEAEAVVLAAPASAAAGLVAPFSPEAASELRAIESVAVTVVGLGFASAADRPAALDGFGFLVARGERLSILGALAESSIWPRDTKAFVCRAMIRGGTDLSDEALVARARDDLRTAVGLETPPSWTRVARWKEAIPQYALGHRARLARIDAALAGWPGLALAGASYRGVAVNDLCRDAVAVAVTSPSPTRGRS